MNHLLVSIGHMNRKLMQKLNVLLNGVLQQPKHVRGSVVPADCGLHVREAAPPLLGQGLNQLVKTARRVHSRPPGSLGECLSVDDGGGSPGGTSPHDEVPC